MTMPSPLPANWTTGETFSAESENDVESAVNWLMYLELNDQFGDDSDGAPSTAASGQSYSSAYTTSSAALSVTSGLLSNPAASSTGWISCPLEGSVVYLEADFAFASSGSTNNQTLILGSSNAALSGTISSITTSPCYVVFGNSGYSVYYWSGSTETQIGSTVNYPSTQGTADQHVEVAIDVDNNSIWVRGADGAVNGFTDANITGTNIYAVLGAAYAASTDHVVNISRWAASSQLLTNETPFSYRAQALKQEGLALSAQETVSNKTFANPTVEGYTEGVASLGTVGSAATIDINSGTVVTATLTSATPCTFTMPTATAGKSFVLLLKQPSSGAATTATFTGVEWPSSSGAPTITATVGSLDALTFFSDGSNWYGTYVQGYTY